MEIDCGVPRSDLTAPTQEDARRAAVIARGIADVLVTTVFPYTVFGRRLLHESALFPTSADVSDRGLGMQGLWVVTDIAVNAVLVAGAVTGDPFLLGSGVVAKGYPLFALALRR